MFDAVVAKIENGHSGFAQPFSRILAEYPISIDFMGKTAAKEFRQLCHVANHQLENDDSPENRKGIRARIINENQRSLLKMTTRMDQHFTSTNPSATFENRRLEPVITGHVRSFRSIYYWDLPHSSSTSKRDAQVQLMENILIGWAEITSLVVEPNIGKIKSEIQAIYEREQSWLKQSTGHSLTQNRG